MKKDLKLNKLPLVVIIFLTILAIFAIGKYIYDYSTSYKNTEIIIEKIQSGEVQWPVDILPALPKMDDAFSIYFGVVVENQLRMLPTVIPVLIILCSTYGFYKKLRSGYIKNNMLRENYNTFIKKNIFSSLKNMLLIPYFVILMMILCIIISPDLKITENVGNIFNYAPMISAEYTKNLPLFLLAYIINLALLSGYYINISLIFLKIKLPYIINCVGSFLFVWGSLVLLEIGVGKVLEYKFGLAGMNAAFNQFVFWSPGDGASMFMMFLVVFTLFITTLFLVFKTYKNKEEVLKANGL